jgi:hypothetical protein
MMEAKRALSEHMTDGSYLHAMTKHLKYTNDLSMKEEHLAGLNLSSFSYNCKYMKSVLGCRISNCIRPSN